MTDKKFDPKKLKKLNNPDRLKDTPPDLIWNNLKLTNPKVLVDIGAGTGFFSIPFVNLTKDGKVYACDISDTMIDWMKENICKEHKNVIPVKMEETRVDLPSGTADFVFMINLHHELDEPLKIMQECFRLLKKGGKIAVIDWKKEEMDQGPPLSIRCTPKEVEKQMEETGLSEVKGFNDLPKHFMVTGVR